MKVINLVNEIHHGGFTCGSISSESILINNSTQEIKFNPSGLTQVSKTSNFYLKGVLLKKSSATVHNTFLDKLECEKKDQKWNDRYMIALTFFKVASFFKTNPTFGAYKALFIHILQDLNNPQLSLTSVYKKYNQVILERCPNFYRQLSLILRKERKLRAALEIIQVYDHIMKSDQEAYRDFINKRKRTPSDLGINYRIQADLHLELQETTLAVNAALEALRYFKECGSSKTI